MDEWKTESWEDKQALVLILVLLVNLLLCFVYQKTPKRSIKVQFWFYCITPPSSPILQLCLSTLALRTRSFILFPPFLFDSSQTLSSTFAFSSAVTVCVSSLQVWSIFLSLWLCSHVTACMTVWYVCACHIWGLTTVKYLTGGHPLKALQFINNMVSDLCVLLFSIDFFLIDLNGNSSTVFLWAWKNMKFDDFFIEECLSQTESTTNSLQN